MMSDKRQRARVQGSWAKQMPKHPGPTGNLSCNSYCEIGMPITKLECYLDIYSFIAWMLIQYWGTHLIESKQPVQ